MKVPVELIYSQSIPEWNEWYDKNYWIHYPIDLTSNNFENLDLSGIRLWGAVLNNTVLSKTRLIKADLRCSTARKVICVGTIFDLADLAVSEFSQAKLVSCSFFKANLSNANLEKADLQESSFAHCNMYQINLEGAKIKKTNFESANLFSANLQGVEVKNGIFTNARMTWPIK